MHLTSIILFAYLFIPHFNSKDVCVHVNSSCENYYYVTTSEILLGIIQLEANR